MITLITYDISNPKRLTKMHKFLKNYGINTQKSVFECEIDDDELNAIKRFAKKELNKKFDSLRIYKICSTCLSHELIVGKGIKVLNVDYKVY